LCARQISCEDASWALLPSPWVEDAFIIEAITVKGYYLRHKNYKLVISESDDSRVFRFDSSWFVLGLRRLD